MEKRRFGLGSSRSILGREPENPRKMNHGRAELWVRLILSAAATVLFGGCAVSHPYRVQIKDPDGNPVQGATIHPTPLYPKSSNKRTSDRRGMLASAVGSFVVVADGFEPKLVDVWSERRAVIHLTPSQATARSGEGAIGHHRFISGLMRQAVELYSDRDSPTSAAQ